MYATVVARSAFRRSLIAQSTRSFASRAHPPPKVPPKATTPADNVQSSKPESAQAESAPKDGRQEAESFSKPLSALPSLDFAPGEEPHRERTGAKSSKDSLSSIERKRRLWSRVSIGVLLAGATLTTYYMGRELDEYDLKEFRLVRSSTYRV